MSVALRVILVLVVLVIGGVLAFLMIWEPPPPNQPIDEPISRELEP